MEICYIIGAGELPLLYINEKKEHIVIAADGGLSAIEGIKPDMIVGDFDSLGFVPKGENTLVLPVEKDVTDMRCAVDQGLGKGCEIFVIYGGTGGRPDHTFANYGLLSYVADKGGRAYLIGDGFIAVGIKNAPLALPAKKEGTVSVFAADGDAIGVTIKGLKYTLNDHKLTFSHPLGVSNSFVGEDAEISVKDGTLIVFFEENNIPDFIDNLQ
jgi:thiamine pyrophosphokinase